MCSDVVVETTTRSSRSFSPEFQPQYPFLSDESVANIWSSIAFAKVGVPLEALHVKTCEKVKDFERGFFGTYWQEYEHIHGQQFTPRPSSTDDRGGEVKVLETVRDGESVWKMMDF